MNRYRVVYPIGKQTISDSDSDILYTYKIKLMEEALKKAQLVSVGYPFNLELIETQMDTVQVDQLTWDASPTTGFFKKEYHLTYLTTSLVSEKQRLALILDNIPYIIDRIVDLNLNYHLFHGNLIFDNIDIMNTTLKIHNEQKKVRFINFERTYLNKQNNMAKSFDLLTFYNSVYPYIERKYDSFFMTAFQQKYKGSKFDFNLYELCQIYIAPYQNAIHLHKMTLPIISSLLATGIGSGLLYKVYSNSTLNSNQTTKDTKYLLPEGPVKSDQKIPKRIHQIWLGTLPVPKETKGWQHFCSKYKWEYKLWNEEDLETFQLENQKEFDEPGISYPQKSDIFRYEIMYRFGGLYIDCDMEWLGKNISDFIPFDTSQFIGVTTINSHGFSTIPWPHIENGFFSCIKHSKIMRDVIDSIPKQKKTMNAFTNTGPPLLNSMINEPITVIPGRWIFPTRFYIPNFKKVDNPKQYEDQALIVTHSGFAYEGMSKLDYIKKTLKG